MFIITGWSAALLTATTHEVVLVDAVKARPRTQFAFRRIMA